MKSNEERVQSIVSKAKRYKTERKMTLSTAAIVFCAVIAVTLQTSINENKVNINAKSSGERKEVASLYTNEENISTFSSKEELVSTLKELSENAKENYRYRGGIYFADDAYDMVTNEAMEQSSGLKIESASQTKLAESEDYSATNTQVQGVDEADIVKTNGEKIFYLTNDKLEIIDTTKKKLAVSKEITFDDNDMPFEMYLDDKYFVVLANCDVYNEPIVLEQLKMKEISRVRGTSTTKALIYDINSYELVREIEVEGNEIASRKIGENIYIVTNKYVYIYDDIDIENSDILPICRDTSVSSEYREIPATEVKYFNDLKEDPNCNYMIITSFNLGDLESKAKVNTYLGAGNDVYCSKENLYVAKVKHQYTYTPKITNVIDEAIGVSGTSSNEISTSIHKFSINNGEVKHVATGKVEGTLLNQFSMDEYDGNFRITTTTDDEGNNLFVLDDDMKEIGSVTNLASGERIYATRFMGDKAYVVTYKTVDPLFVIDLSDPSKPSVLGELKIPGYSSYLHPLGENYLIGFGEDSVEKSYLNWEGEQEVVAYANGLKMAIFDVSDYSNPKELYSIKIGNRGSYSEFLYNHKALLFDENEGIFAFPAYLTSDGGYYQDGTPMYGDKMFEGALIYDVSVENGITLRGKIEHEGERESIERIVRIGNKLYTLSNGAIKVSDIKDIKELDTLKF